MCLVLADVRSDQINVIGLVTCAEYNSCRLYSEMLIYEPFPNNAELKKYEKYLLNKKEIVTQ